MKGRDLDQRKNVVNNQDREWTDVDLDRLRQLDDARTAIEDIAQKLQRTPVDVEDRLSIVRMRSGGVTNPDEEGDIEPSHR